MLQNNINSEAQTRSDEDTLLSNAITEILVQSKSYVDTKLTDYLTEEEVYEAIAEKVIGRDELSGEVPARTLLPTTVDDFELWFIQDENLIVLAVNSVDGLRWLPYSGNIDLSAYETITGATEKANTAEDNANAYTDSVTANKADIVAGKGFSTNDFTNELKAGYDAHLIDYDNPHQVTPEKIGAATAAPGADCVRELHLACRYGTAEDNWILINHKNGAYRLQIGYSLPKMIVGCYNNGYYREGYAEALYVYANQPFDGFVKLG